MTEQEAPAANQEPPIVSVEKALELMEKSGVVRVDRSTHRAAADEHEQREAAAKNQRIWDLDAQIGPLLKSPIKNKAKIDELKAQRAKLESQR